MRVIEKGTFHAQTFVYPKLVRRLGLIKSFNRCEKRRPIPCVPSLSWQAFVSHSPKGHFAKRNGSTVFLQQRLRDDIRAGPRVPVRASAGEERRRSGGAVGSPAAAVHVADVRKTHFLSRFFV